jgi:hypothetical protein
MPLEWLADISLPDFLAADDVVSSRITAKTDVARKTGLTGTSRGRLDYPLDHGCGWRSCESCCVSITVNFYPATDRQDGL